MSEDATIPVARDHGVGTNGGAAGPLMDSLGSLAMAMPERVGHAAVHIGLGKTATTFLQTNVFPLLEKHGVIDSYNAPRLLAMAGKHHLVGLSDQELATFAATFQQSGRVFLSNESLSPWNPADWKAARDRNLQLFGPDTTIIITIREPLSYLTSVYLRAAGLCLA